VKTSLSERIIFRALRWWSRREFRKQWGQLPYPHFEDHRLLLIEALFGRGTFLGLHRGFLALEGMPGKRVLNIGCGDGFFDRWLFSEVAEHVDSIDIEDSAIDVAIARHSASNISYYLMDATKEFPPRAYDVIVWDGAIGHFDPKAVDSMLKRIFDALNPGGVFVGSESLGTEGTDHLQFFATADDLVRVLSAHFPNAQAKALSYRLRPGGYLRTEAYWKATRGPESTISSVGARSSGNM
jgi:SAM-dependent methyltransferase